MPNKCLTIQAVLALLARAWPLTPDPLSPVSTQGRGGALRLGDCFTCKVFICCVPARQLVDRAYMITDADLKFVEQAVQLAIAVKVTLNRIRWWVACWCVMGWLSQRDIINALVVPMRNAKRWRNLQMARPKELRLMLRSSPVAIMAQNTAVH